MNKNTNKQFENYAKNTNQHLGQINNTIENLVSEIKDMREIVTGMKNELEPIKQLVRNTNRQNEEIKQLFEETKHHSEDLKELVAAMKNEMEQARERHANLLTDQHNATNQPPSPPRVPPRPPPPIPPRPQSLRPRESNNCTLKFLFTEGYKEYIVRHRSTALKATYSTWYTMLCNKTNGNQLYKYEKNLLAKNRFINKWRRVFFELKNGDLKAMAVSSNVVTFTLNEGWSREDMKHILILHPTDASRTLEGVAGNRFNNNTWIIDKITEDYYSLENELVIICQKH